jgi:hypothetical protein
MVKKKNTPTKKSTELRVPGTSDDVKTAILITSLALNLAIFIGWIILRVTSKYDEQVFNFLFIR